jgi:hypothetical protein
MPQLCADREPSFSVHLALLRCQILGSRAAGCRCRPTGEFAVADLRVLVSMPVDAVHACRSALVFEPPLAGVNYPGQRVGKDAVWGKVGVCRARCLTRISTPFGGRVSGDEAGDGARLRGTGRCDNGHQPG